MPQIQVVIKEKKGGAQEDGTTSLIRNEEIVPDERGAPIWFPSCTPELLPARAVFVPVFFGGWCDEPAAVKPFFSHV